MEDGERRRDTSTTWKCSKCTFVNPMSSSLCDICYSIKETAVEKTKRYKGSSSLSISIPRIHRHASSFVYTYIFIIYTCLLYSPHESETRTTPSVSWKCESPGCRMNHEISRYITSSPTLFSINIGYPADRIKRATLRKIFDTIKEKSKISRTSSFTLIFSLYSSPYCHIGTFFLFRTESLRVPS